MKRVIALAGIGLFGLGALAACSDSVDRDGTKDALVKTIEDAGGSVDGDCVDDVFDKYSDDELKDFDDALQDGEPNAEATAFIEELSTCLSAG